MIVVSYNGEKKKIAEPLILQDFFDQAGIVIPDCGAIMLNQHHVIKQDYSTTYLKDGDQVECLTPMQGG